MKPSVPRLPDPLSERARLSKPIQTGSSVSGKKPRASRSGQVNDDARYLAPLTGRALVDLAPIFTVEDVPRIFNDFGRGPMRPDADYLKIAEALNLMVQQPVTRQMMRDGRISVGREADAFENIGARARDLLVALGYRCDGSDSPDLKKQSAGAGAALGHLRHLLRDYASPPLRNPPFEALHLIHPDNRFVDHISPPADQHDPDAHWDRVVAAEVLAMLPEALAVLIGLACHTASRRLKLQASTKRDDLFSALIFGRWILAYELTTGHFPTGGKGKKTTSIEVGPLVCALKIAADRLPACLKGVDSGAAVAALQRLAGLPYPTLAGHIKSANYDHSARQAGATSSGSQATRMSRPMTESG